MRFRNHNIIHFYKRQENCNFQWLLSECCFCNDVRFVNGLKFKNARRFVGENKSFRILEFTWWNSIPEKCFGSQIMNWKQEKNAVFCLWKFNIICFYKRPENYNFHWSVSEWCFCNDAWFESWCAFFLFLRFVLWIIPLPKLSFSFFSL